MLILRWNRYNFDGSAAPIVFMLTDDAVRLSGEIDEAEDARWDMTMQVSIAGEVREVDLGLISGAQVRMLIEWAKGLIN